MNWFYLAHDGDWRQAFVNTVTNFSCPNETENALTELSILSACRGFCSVEKLISGSILIERVLCLFCIHYWP